MCIFWGDFANCITVKYETGNMKGCVYISLSHFFCLRTLRPSYCKQSLQKEEQFNIYSHRVLSVM